MKTLHKLKEKNIILDDFYVFDTETNGLRAKSDAFIFGVVIGKNYKKVIYSVDEFKKEFEHPRYFKKKVFAHNLEYDANVIYDNIYKVDNKAIFNHKLICFTNGNCLFCDSTNIFIGASVKALGELLGLKKLEISEEYTTGTFKGKITKKMINYCERDCLIVYYSLIKIFEEVGNIKITVASLSLDYFRRKYLNFNLDYNDQLGKYFYDSYYGGRTEAFYIGKLTACCYDINSMYPFAMSECLFPNPKKLKIIYNVKKDVFINNYLKYYEGLIKLELFHKKHSIGFLPYKQNGKLLFPTGHLKGSWNFNEIRFCLENNIIDIIKIDYIIYSDRMPSFLKQYANDLYEKRNINSNPLNREIYKRLLNALYGKFAQRIKAENIYIENIEKEFYKIKNWQLNKKLIKITPFNKDRKDCFVTIKSDRGYMYHSIPLISSYITSFARIELLKYLLKYINYFPVYCDTDSIFFKKDPEIINSNKLGEWKKENKVITEIRGLKNYSYIGEGKKTFDKIKGIPKSAKKINGKYIYKTLRKTKEGLRQKKEIGILIEREKILSGTYDKRIVLKNGETKPIEFKM